MEIIRSITETDTYRRDTWMLSTRLFVDQQYSQDARAMALEINGVCVAVGTMRLPQLHDSHYAVQIASIPGGRKRCGGAASRPSYVPSEAILSPTMTDMDLMTTKRTRFVVIRIMSLASRTQSSPIPAKHEKLMGPTAARLATKVNLKSPTRPIYQLRTTDHRKLFKRNTLRDAGSPNSSQ